jgi:hypothetical protein
MEKSINGYIIPTISEEESRKIWEGLAKKEENNIFNLSSKERKSIIHCLIEEKIKTEISWHENDLSYLNSLNLSQNYNLKWIELMYDNTLTRIQTSLDDIMRGINFLLSSPHKEDLILSVEKTFDDLLEKVQVSKDNKMNRK